MRPTQLTNTSKKELTDTRIPNPYELIVFHQPLIRIGTPNPEQTANW
jgi:hypothetical protein